MPPPLKETEFLLVGLLVSVSVAFFFFLMMRRPPRSTRETTTLSLHDALPIFQLMQVLAHTNPLGVIVRYRDGGEVRVDRKDRKSTRLNSSHSLTSRMPSS